VISPVYRSSGVQKEEDLTANGHGRGVFDWAQIWSAFFCTTVLSFCTSIEKVKI